MGIFGYICPTRASTPGSTPAGRRIATDLVGYSADSQRKTLESFASGKSIVFDSVFADDASQFGQPWQKRPAGAKCNDVLTVSDCLVVARAAAFLSLKPFQLIERLHGRGVLLHLVDLVDASTPIGSHVLEALAKMAGIIRSWGSEQATKRIRELKTARRPTGPAPYPFHLGGPRGKRRLELDRHKRRFGAQFLQWRREGMTFVDIWRRLLKSRTRWRGREFALSTIKEWTAAEAQLQAAEAAAQPMSPN